MYLVTGAAGFIGYHTSMALFQAGMPVLGIDNLNTLYYTAPKKQRLERLTSKGGKHFQFLQCDITQADFAAQLEPYASRITHVIHLAAIANVRYSLQNPTVYLANNTLGQQAMLELCRTLPALTHFIYASSSSVYGDCRTLPFHEALNTDTPISIYAASKKAAEVVTETYAHLYRIPATGLRLFSVYGPWGRPDMAYYSFARKMLAGEPIQLFNHGQMQRDFTYIDDIVSGILAAATTAKRKEPHAIYNLGSGRGESLEQLVTDLEEVLGVKAIRQHVPVQPAEAVETCADISKAARDLGYKPRTQLRDGLKHFATWYKEFAHA